MMTTHFLVPRRRVAPAVALGWSDFDRVFDSLWNGFGVAPRFGAATLAPRIDVTETDAEIQVSAELPGLDEKDIQVSLDSDVLKIRGERVAEKRTDEKGIHHVETHRGAYERSLRLSTEVDADAVKAVYRNGVLTVTLPKAHEAQVRNIPVTAGS